MNTLNILAKKNDNVKAVVYTMSHTRLTTGDIQLFNSQYPSLEVKYTDVFHDRFLIIDDTIAYHIGASLKDAGKKCFAINIIKDSELVDSLKQRISTLP